MGGPSRWLVRQETPFWPESCGPSSVSDWRATGPMVLDICRHVLDDSHDAQDAFQATFLVLLRRARSIRNRDSLASWLFGVAMRVARQARYAAVVRRFHEHHAG